MDLGYEYQWKGYFSWLGNLGLGAKYKNIRLFPEMRRQTGFDDCSFCSLCPSVELRSQRSWIDHGEYESNKSYRIDIELLKILYPPPQSPCVIIERIVNVFGGRIKATGHEDYPIWPFKVKDCKTYHVYPGAYDRENSVNAVLNHIKVGPVIGGFRVCKNYTRITYPHILYVGNGDYVPLSPQYPDVALQHAVCIVGVMPLKRGRQRAGAYEVLEPGLLIDESVRKRFILCTDMDFIFVPEC